MSGFDFDALRDANAPIPGERERNEVNARAHHLRARRIRNRLALSAGALVLVAAIVLAVVGAQHDSGPEIAVPGASTTTLSTPSTVGPSISTRVVPPTPTPTTTTTSTTTTSTTTSAPAVSGIPPAVSATWVSPRQGWVLEKSGVVAETTDGGSTWTPVGRLGIVIPNGVGTQIRFADATHGFVLSNSEQGKLYDTIDGGAHWQPMSTPFVDVFALTISRGTIYAVAMQPRDAHLRIWSAPADAPAWVEDPLSIPPGAGPAISIQLVFSGTHGWLIENDRGVVGGARRTGTGGWVAWSPPLGDGVSLAASTANDLVASGQEGVWTGPSITNHVYFSHDGGSTFSRLAAPDVGAVASPNPNTAVVAGLNGVQRTTDGGLTWHLVLAVGNTYGATDIGFTTTTQGFVIFGNGKMFMTYDAGATWTQSTRP